MTKQELIDFEEDIKKEYEDAKIRAPIHLSDGNEDQVMEIFKSVKRNDWVFSTWRNHYHALLHGVPKELLKEKIMRGESITIMSAEHKFFSSAIVGGILPIATGVAMGNKLAGVEDHVWCFVGDMGSSGGAFYESVKYATNFDLPITYVIEDNDYSVSSPTKKCWNEKEGDLEPCMPKQIQPKVLYYKYHKNLPHVGVNKFITF